MNCKAACIQVDITPDFPVELIGCYREDSTSTGILHPLCAQILLVEADNKRYCLVTIDNLGLTTHLSAELRKLISDNINTVPANVMLNFSHTHSAPAPLSPLNGQKYFQLMCERIVSGSWEAAASLKPCLAAWDVIDTDIAENRRDNCTVVDKRLGALYLTSKEDGQPLALVLRVSCHANVLMTNNSAVSSDFIGIARAKIADHRKCPVMIMQGSAGNLKPVKSDKIYGGTLVDAKDIAEQLFQSSKTLSFQLEEINSIDMYEKNITFYADVPTKKEAAKIAADADSLFGTDGSAWLTECNRLRCNGITSQTLTEQLHFFSLNDGCFCGLPNELFCEIALEAAAKKGSSRFFLNGYTNGCTSYIPHAEEWAKGGYETLYSLLSYYSFHGQVMPFQRDTAERIVECAVTE